MTFTALDTSLGWDGIYFSDYSDDGSSLIDSCIIEYADDGIYWMPLEFGQTEEKLATSLMYEDKLLLETRVKRFSGKKTYSQSPKSRCQHLLQTPMVDLVDSTKNEYRIFTPFHYAEVRHTEKENFEGWMKHSLIVEGEKLKIKLKRVDLVNCDAPHRNIQLFI